MNDWAWFCAVILAAITGLTIVTVVKILVTGGCEDE